MLNAADASYAFKMLSHFSRRNGIGKSAVLESVQQSEMVRMGTWIFIIVSLASVALAHHMARTRGRSPQVWSWIAILFGPLAPVMLLILGKHADAPAAN